MQVFVIFATAVDRAWRLVLSTGWCLWLDLAVAGALGLPTQFVNSIRRPFIYLFAGSCMKMSGMYGGSLVLDPRAAFVYSGIAVLGVVAVSHLSIYIVCWRYVCMSPTSNSPCAMALHRPKMTPKIAEVHGLIIGL